MQPETSGSNSSNSSKPTLILPKVGAPLGYHPPRWELRRWLMIGLLAVLMSVFSFYAGRRSVLRMETPLSPPAAGPSAVNGAISNHIAPSVPVSTGVSLLARTAFTNMPPPALARETPATTHTNRVTDAASLPPALPALPLGEASTNSPNTNFVVRVVREGSVVSKRIALTLDDGPQPIITPKVLAVLREQQVKATFFVLGDRVKQHPEILPLIIAGGHEIGNHTYDHRLLTVMTKELIQRELYETQELIRNASGRETHLFRPPYGAYRPTTKAVLQELGLHIVLWSVDPEDWRIHDAEKIVQTVTNKVQNGSIIVCHDIYKSTLQALPTIISVLKSNSFEFVTVNELCGLPVSTPVSVAIKPAEPPSEGVLREAASGGKK